MIKPGAKLLFSFWCWILWQFVKKSINGYILWQTTARVFYMLRAGNRKPESQAHQCFYDCQRIQHQAL